MVLKRLKKGTTFSMKTSSKSMWILNENSEKFLGLNLKRTWCNFFSGLQVYETWTRDLSVLSDQFNSWKRV
jgi:hypothetical protein